MKKEFFWTELALTAIIACCKDMLHDGIWSSRHLEEKGSSLYMGVNISEHLILSYMGCAHATFYDARNALKEAGIIDVERHGKHIYYDILVSEQEIEAYYDATWRLVRRFKN